MIVIKNSTYIAKIAFSFWLIWVVKSSIIALVFSSDPQVGTAFNAVISCFFAALLSVELKNKFRAPTIASAKYWIVAYLVWAGLSLFWTKADSALIAGFYWAVMTLDVFVVWLLLGLDRRAVVLRDSLKGIIAGGLILVFLIVFVFHVGDSGRIEDAILHTNSLGAQLGTSLVCMLYFFPEKNSSLTYKNWWYVICCLLISGLLMTLSKTSILAYFVSLAAFLYLARLARGGIVALLLIVLGLTGFFWSAIEVYIIAYLLEGSSGSMSAFETLSGRTLLWEDAWYMIKEAMYLGYGFMSFRDYGPDIFSIRVSHAHNDLIQQWFSLGLVGVILSIIIYMHAIKNWWSLRVGDIRGVNQAAFCLAMAIYFIVRGLTEASAVGLVFPAHIILLLLATRSITFTNHTSTKRRQFHSLSKIRIG